MTGPVWVSLALAALLVLALAKPTRQMVGGFIQRDRKGRLVLVLTPVPKPKRRRRRT